MRLHLLWLTVLLLVAACADESPAERQPAGPGEPASARSAPRPPRAEAHLVSTGRLAYDGDGEPRCVLHDETGLQINLRTGDLDLPAVALRITEYHGEGHYSGNLFLTGRNGGGALLGSTGTVEIQVAQPQPADARGVQVLSGTFEGRYAGTAGQGTVKGRFERCPYRPGRGGLPQLAKELANPAASRSARPGTVPSGP